MEDAWWPPVVRGFLLLCSVWLLSSLATILVLVFFVREPRVSFLERSASAAVVVILLIMWFVDFRLPHYFMKGMAEGRLSLAAFNTILSIVRIAANVLLGVAVGVLVFAFETGPGKSNQAEAGAAADRPRD